MKKSLIVLFLLLVAAVGAAQAADFYTLGVTNGVIGTSGKAVRLLKIGAVCTSSPCTFRICKGTSACGGLGTQQTMADQLLYFIPGTYGVTEIQEDYTSLGGYVLPTGAYFNPVTGTVRARIWYAK